MIVKSFIFIILLSLTLPCLAGEIVLLTSLKLNKLSTWQLEKKFKKVFKDSHHDIRIHHKAGPRELHQALTSSETVALIWVSHAASEQDLGHGYKAGEVILDYWGNDVKNFFTLVPENLKFLGLVGCEANQIIEGFRDRGHYEAFPHLEIKSFDYKVRLSRGFKETLKSAVLALQKGEAISDTSEIPVTFYLQRTTLSAQDGLHSGWVEIGDRVLTFFEDQETHERSSSISTKIWENIKNKNIRFFKVRGGEQSEDGLGHLQVNIDQREGVWNLFARRGKPIGGKEQQLYLFRRNH